MGSNPSVYVTVFFFVKRINMSGGSSGRIVTTIYQDGPDDSLIVKDGYEGSKPYAGTKTGTSYDELRSAAIDTLDQLKEHSKDLKTEPVEINKNISVPKEKSEPLDKNEGYRRMSGSDGSILGSLNSLSSEASSLFTMNNTDSSVTGSSGNIKTSLSLTDITALLNIVNKLSNGNYSGTAKDTGAASKLIATTTAVASNNGINDTYQALVKNPSIDKKVLVNAAVSSIKETINNDNVNLTLDVSKAGLLSDAIIKEPSLVSKILSVKLNDNVSQKDKKLLFKSLFDSFTKSGFNWNKSKKNGEFITDLGSNILSTDMAKALLVDICSVPLTVYVGEETTKNAAIDKQLTHPSLTSILSIVYDDLTFEEQQSLIELWNSQEHKDEMEEHNVKIDYYLGSLFTYKNPVDEISQLFHFKKDDLINRINR